MSKSAVTAGLIGGRVGNKGGVGISLKIEETTFLFLNAHLAGMIQVKILKVASSLPESARRKSSSPISKFIENQSRARDECYDRY